MRHPDDLLTLLETREPCNKIVHLVNGEPVKKPGRPISQAIARTIYIADVRSMEGLLRTVANMDNLVLVQGYAKGACQPGDEYQILAKQELEKTSPGYKSGWVDVAGQRTTARLKVNFQPSSWWQLDRDYADGIPNYLANMTDEAWVRAIDFIMPGFAKAGFVRVASTSGRVLHNGLPLDAQGCRYWFQVQDPNDVDFGERLKMQAAANGLAFNKPNAIGIRTLWTIFDPTVFSYERLVYDGRPTVGLGLYVGEPDITSQSGGRIDTSLIRPLTRSQKDEVKARFGVEVKRNRSGVLASVQVGSLTLDTAIETPHDGVITVREFLASGQEKLRCQATFRDSTSWNGFLYRDHRSMPVLFDNGTRTRYELTAIEQVQLAFGVYE